MSAQALRAVREEAALGAPPVHDRLPTTTGLYSELVARWMARDWQATAVLLDLLTEQRNARPGRLTVGRDAVFLLIRGAPLDEPSLHALVADIAAATLEPELHWPEPAVWSVVAQLIDARWRWARGQDDSSRLCHLRGLLLELPSLVRRYHWQAGYHYAPRGAPEELVRLLGDTRRGALNVACKAARCALAGRAAPERLLPLVAHRIDEGRASASTSAGGSG